MQSYKHLKVKNEGRVKIVTFNRPDQLNALNIEMMNEISDFSFKLNEDGVTRVVVFTGEGEHFCSGMDLTDKQRIDQHENDNHLMKLRHMKIGPEMIRRLFEIDQITIAAINGAAVGGGACIAAACDFRIGETDSKIGYPEVKLAMNLSWTSLPMLVHLVGPVKAKQMVILAETFDASTMKDWGFLDDVVPGEILMNNVMKLAKKCASQAPIAAQMVKRSVNAISSALDRAIMHMDSDQFLYATSGKDFEEGIQAFLEKRKPEFKGD
ncbi:MAG: enoyl-CoA hydratase/isomerase family protein [Proteobacteria bacterium]|nr:enoyl-CoA hydratase/isomerase family protein [Pseudomonadota bacterium]